MIEETQRRELKCSTPHTHDIKRKCELYKITVQNIWTNLNNTTAVYLKVKHYRLCRKRKKKRMKTMEIGTYTKWSSAIHRIWCSSLWYVHGCSYRHQFSGSSCSPLLPKPSLFLSKALSIASLTLPDALLLKNGRRIVAVRPNVLHRDPI